MRLNKRLLQATRARFRNSSPGSGGADGRDELPLALQLAEVQALWDLWRPIVLMVVILIAVALSGCRVASRLDRTPQVIAVPEATVPHHLDEGEAAPFAGWLVSPSLLNEWLPALRDVYGGPGEDDGWKPAQP